MKTDKKIEELTSYFGDWFNDGKTLDTGKMTQDLYPYDMMFSPVKVNRITIKNRLVMAPMGNISMCDETGRPNEKMLAYFTERAKGGVGLITTGLVPVSHGLDHTITELGQLTYFPRIDRSRTVFAGWRDLAANVHSYGSRIFIQLTAGLGRVGNPQCLVNSLKFPQSASFNPSWYMPELPCLRMSDIKCKKIISNIGQAAADAKAMNLDGVYLHGHEGYLIEQMTNPAFNRRSLGHFANWQNFGIDMVKKIRERTDKNFPIMYRIDLSLALNETYGERMNEVSSLKKFRKGRTIEMTLEYMKNLVEAGVDMFDVDLGCYDNWWLPHPPGSMPPGCFLDISKIAKDYFETNGIKSNAGLPVPVVAVGKLGYPDLAEKALRDGKCDMIMLGRPLLADAYWPNKARTGRVNEIRPCIGCQEACLNEFVEGGHPQCAVNPRTAFEEVYPETPAPAEKPCNIAVIGAGPGGIMTAVTAAKRGHKVTLIEKDSRLGGRLNSASAPGIKFDVANYLEYLKGAVERAQKDYGLEVLLSTEATAESLKGKYDKVVVAAGTTDTVLPLPGLDKANWQQAVAVLENPELAKGAKKVVVIGGGVVGSETAYFLKKELGVEDVTVVEMDKYIMNHTCTANRGYLLKYMYDSGIKLLNCTKSVSFDEKGVVVSRNTSKSVPDPYLSWNPILPENVPNPLAPKLKNEPVEEHLDADLIVMAAGGRPNEALFLELQQKLNTIEVYNLGDSFKGGKVFEATKSGYALALSL
ncbi:MAG: FAD-dependent oxidoreductase [Oscillospiraceae bacterium]|nr:FAD-dependent oxidoreductase [Ruminococcus sp.]MDD7338950.1 FAD-dependent oxidoreductase [Ruminococcus sp.]MDY6060515.1 FAD-dependent oxidoreductase [Oscillospiraceae bacterium]